MGFIPRLAVAFYVVAVLFVATITLLFVTNVIEFDNVYLTLIFMYYDFNMRVAVGAVAAGILLINFTFARIISGHQMREKNIAFDNPSGRVTISLMAMDDMIRQLITKVPEVKDIRPSIIATKKGLEIDARLVLRSDVNIPEVTARLQELIKRKVQDTLGVDEAVLVRIHVAKLSLGDVTKRSEDFTSSETIPFRGYRP